MDEDLALKIADEWQRRQGRDGRSPNQLKYQREILRRSIAALVPDDLGDEWAIVTERVVDADDGGEEPIFIAVYKEDSLIVGRLPDADDDGEAVSVSMLEGYEWRLLRVTDAWPDTGEIQRTWVYEERLDDERSFESRQLHVDPPPDPDRAELVGRAMALAKGLPIKSVPA